MLSQWVNGYCFEVVQDTVNAEFENVPMLYLCMRLC